MIMNFKAEITKFVQNNISKRNSQNCGGERFLKPYIQKKDINHTLYLNTFALRIQESQINKK